MLQKKVFGNLLLSSPPRCICGGACHRQAGVAVAHPFLFCGYARHGWDVLGRSRDRGVANIEGFLGLRELAGSLCMD